MEHTEPTNYEEVQRDGLDLPEGYTVGTERFLEEESGQARRVLLLKRVDDSVAWMFAFRAGSPTAEAVSARTWDDRRATGGIVS